MIILAAFIGVIIIWIIVQLIRLFKADCDLTLQWATKFGQKPAKLIGKVVWITGASSGIGEYLAYELAKAGCRLVLSARRRDQLERVKAQCLLIGRVTEDDVLVLPLDVMEFDTHAGAMAAVLDKFSQIDILVNNAGRTQRAMFETICMEVHREMYELNVLAALSLTRAVLPHMYKLNQGHIVVVSSIAGKVGVPNSASYCATKHAVHGAYECLRVELRQTKIGVTMLCPGPVFSNILATAFTGKQNEVLNGEMKAGERRMSTERCAFLCAAAIANKLDEVWISLNPVLMMTYCMQYVPTYSKRVITFLGSRVNNIREGQ